MSKLILLLVTPLLLTACSQTQTRLPAEPPALSSHTVAPVRQTVNPDIYDRAPEVVRYDRYRLVDISPTHAQQFPLEQIVSLRIPGAMNPTVGDALRYVLRESGWRLCSLSGQADTLYRQPLPAVQNRLGPVRLSVALQLLAGPAWQLEVDEVQRVVCHSLRAGYTLPATPRPAPVSGGLTRSAPVSAPSQSTPLPPQPVLKTQPAEAGTAPSQNVHRGGWLK